MSLVFLKTTDSRHKRFQCEWMNSLHSWFFKVMCKWALQYHNLNLLEKHHYFKIVLNGIDDSGL